MMYGCSFPASDDCFLVMVVESGKQAGETHERRAALILPASV